MTKCLINGHVYKYHAAFQLTSTMEISRELVYIGTGIIVEAGGIPYNSMKQFKFYKTKYRGRRKA